MVAEPADGDGVRWHPVIIAMAMMTMPAAALLVTLTVRLYRPVSDAVKERLSDALRGIRSGAFAAEWRAEQEGGYRRFNALRQAARAHAINQAEVLGRELLERSGVRDAE